jgi:NTE family protein
MISDSSITCLSIRYFPNTSNNIWSHYNNNPLRESLEYVGEDRKNRFANFPIATSVDSKDKFVEPRLLTICVDVQLGSVVTFDSYEYVGKECRICGESIGQEGQPYDRKELIKHLTKMHPDSQPNLDLGKHQEAPLRWSVYNDGEIKIVLYYNSGLELKHVMASGSFPVYFTYEDIEGRKFWDGGILSNTPLRELIQCHRDY